MAQKVTYEQFLSDVQCLRNGSIEDVQYWVMNENEWGGCSQFNLGYGVIKEERLSQTETRYAAYFDDSFSFNECKAKDKGVSILCMSHYDFAENDIDNCDEQFSMHHLFCRSDESVWKEITKYSDEVYYEFTNSVK